MSTVPRKPAPRPAKPVGRYWKGKAPKGAAELPSSDEEDGEEEVQAIQEGDDEALSGEQDFLSGAVAADDDDDEATAGKAKTMSIALRDVEISKDGRVKVGGKEVGGDEEDESEESEEEESEEEKAGGEDEKEESSSEYESSEEEKPKMQFRPVFVPKRARVTVSEREAEAQDTEEALERQKQKEEERKKQSHDMVAESIRRELAEKEKEEEVIDVDDTDGLDPGAEFDAWRLRELARIKRDKEAEIAREQEREEIERRRALPEEQRLKEDMEHAEKLRAEKPKGQQKFLQKYWHKGAFHQDAEILKRHDFTEATESTVDVSALPQVMQVKNFGKRSRTKYTHLLDQDTTAGNGGFGGSGSIKSGGTGLGGGGCFICGGPHMKKDCPQNTGLPPGRPGTGANTTGRGFHNDKPEISWRDRDDGYPPRDRDRGYQQRRSRSRSFERRERQDRDMNRDRSSHDRRGDRPRDSWDRDDNRRRGRDARDRSRSRSPKRGYRPRADDRARARDRGRSRSPSLSRDDRDGKRRRFD